MAFLAKGDLKKIFSGLSSIYIAKGGINDFASMTFDWDMPVTVDTFNFTQEQPTLNRTKVHGLQADWCVTAEAGEITISATVPSIDADLVDYFLGAGTAIADATVTAAAASTGWSGKSYTLSNNKLYVGLGLLSDDGNNLVAIKKIALYATPMFENASTTPFGFTLTGSIEASDDSSNNIVFLSKA